MPTVSVLRRPWLGLLLIGLLLTLELDRLDVVRVELLVLVIARLLHISLGIVLISSKCV